MKRHTVAPEKFKTFWEEVINFLPDLQNVDLLQQEIVALDQQPGGMEALLQANEEPTTLEYLSPPTRAFVKINRAIRQIHPNAAIFVNRNVVMYPGWVRESEQFHAQLVSNLSPEQKTSDSMVMPVFPRFELILTGKDMTTCPVLKRLYLESKKVKIPKDWLVVKFQPPMDRWARGMMARQGHSQVRVGGMIVPGEEIRFRAQMTPQNTLDFTVLVNDEWAQHNITTQQHVAELQGETMELLTHYLGEYKSYQFMDRVTAVPETVYLQRALGPVAEQTDAGKMQALEGFLPWSEVIPTMDKMFFPPETTKKCGCCHIQNDNVDLTPLIERYEFIEPGNYCPYCFAFLVSLLEN